MYNRIEKILELLNPFPSNTVINALNSRIEELGFDGVRVIDAEFDFEDDIYVTLEDDEGIMDIIFNYDPADEEFIITISPDDENDDEEYVTEIDITSMNPPLLKTEMGTFIDVINVSWINKTLIEAILSGNDYEHDELVITDLTTNERMKKVIRGGKAVKVPVVRKRKKKRLTSKQKVGIRKAARKRRAKSSQINRKRKKSLKVRKRKNLKRGMRKGYKVKGT